MENEDFAEAAKLKRAILEATGSDAVAHVMAELKVRHCCDMTTILFNHQFWTEMRQLLCSSFISRRFRVDCANYCILLLLYCSRSSRFLQNAIQEQRYQDASRLSRLAGTSLVITKSLMTLSHIAISGAFRLPGTIFSNKSVLAPPDLPC